MRIILNISKYIVIVGNYRINLTILRIQKKKIYIKFQESFKAIVKYRRDWLFQIVLKEHCKFGTMFNKRFRKRTGQNDVINVYYPRGNIPPQLRGNGCSIVT